MGSPIPVNRHPVELMCRTMSTNKEEKLFADFVNVIHPKKNSTFRSAGSRRFMVYGISLFIYAARLCHNSFSCWFDDAFVCPLLDAFSMVSFMAMNEKKLRYLLGWIVPENNQLAKQSNHLVSMPSIYSIVFVNLTLSVAAPVQIRATENPNTAKSHKLSCQKFLENLFFHSTTFNNRNIRRVENEIFVPGKRWIRINCMGKQQQCLSCRQSHCIHQIRFCCFQQWQIAKQLMTWA